MGIAFFGAEDTTVPEIAANRLYCHFRAECVFVS